MPCKPDFVSMFAVFIKTIIYFLVLPFYQLIHLNHISLFTLSFKGGMLNRKVDTWWSSDIALLVEF